MTLRGACVRDCLKSSGCSCWESEPRSSCCDEVDQLVVSGQENLPHIMCELHASVEGTSARG